jgi:hypothetical protein
LAKQYDIQKKEVLTLPQQIENGRIATVSAIQANMVTGNLRAHLLNARDQFKTLALLRAFQLVLVFSTILEKVTTDALCENRAQQLAVIYDCQMRLKLVAAQEYNLAVANEAVIREIGSTFRKDSDFGVAVEAGKVLDAKLSAEAASHVLAQAVTELGFEITQVK